MNPIYRLKHLANEIYWFRAMHYSAGGEQAVREIKFLPQWKFFLRWIKSLNGRSPIKDEQPWMTFGAIDFLKKRINRTDQIFEWGSGGSTVFFRKHTNDVVSMSIAENTLTQQAMYS
jgi:hypothetical protein